MGPTLEEIQQKVTELQAALDAEQQQVKDLLEQKNGTIETLNANIIALQETVAEGGTPEQRQAILDSLSTLKTDLEETVSPAPALEENANASQQGPEGPGAENPQ